MKILVVDDHNVCRYGVRRLLEETPSPEVTEAATGKEALEAIRNRTLDLVILDISLPDRSGLDLLSQIKALAPSLPVIILSMYSEEHYAIRALKSGASGYLSKESASEQLLTAVSRVMSGGHYVSPALAEKLASVVGGGGAVPSHERLSDREMEVLRLMGEGNTLTGIALLLSISVKTVSSHRASLLGKLGLKNNSELIRYALENQLVPSEKH